MGNDALSTRPSSTYKSGNVVQMTGAASGEMAVRPQAPSGARLRTCLGLLRLAKRYSEARLEAACARALAIGSPKRASVKSILESGFDQSPELFQTEAQTPSLLPSHTNIRSADYFNPAPLVPTPTGETLSCSSSKPSIH